jgi:cell division protein FtsQ
VWHSARLLNLAAGLLAALALGLGLYAALRALLGSALFPVREIAVLGRLEHLDRDRLARALAGRISGNFFAADLGAVRRALEPLPWVRRVSVRRVWPDRIEVTVEEHVALARWGDHGLVDTYGEPFDASSDAALPRFVAPPGTEAELARRYRQFGALLARLGETVQGLTLTPRYAWQLRLASGLSLELGRDSTRDPVERRLRRFVAAYPATLGRIAGRHQHVDLRYPNGFALRIPDLRS